MEVEFRRTFHARARLAPVLCLIRRVLLLHKVLRRCALRNTHSVPLDAIVRMYSRWEPDPEAFSIPAAGFA